MKLSYDNLVPVRIVCIELHAQLLIMPVLGKLGKLR